MAKVWHVVIGGKQYGPLSNSELKSLADSKRLQPTDLVWKEGMAEWVPASKIKGLFLAAPPPLPTPPAPPEGEKLADMATAAQNLFEAFARAAKRAGSRIRQAAEKAAALPTTAQENPFAFDAAPKGVSPEGGPATSTAGPRIKLTPGKLGCLAVVVILFLIGVIGQLINPDFGQDTPQAAWVVTQSFVKKRLRSPTSASFPWYDESFVQQLPDEGGKKRYRVSAYVDAQNAFGVKIRTRFTCTVRYVGGKDLVWHLEDLDFDSP